MNVAAYQAIADLKLPATKRLSIGIPKQSGGDPSWLPAINRILKNARGSELLQLTIKDEMLAVVPASITCTALTHLLVSAPTGVDTVLELIEKLPNLIKLTFYNLDFSDIQADMSIPEADGEAAVAPLRTSLKGLAIGHNREQHSLDTAVTVVRHMLLRIPTLAHLLAVQTPRSPVLSFVEAYAPCYPHMGGVKLELDDGRTSEFTRRGFWM
ncbi:hypothetical protein H4R21_003629 [Coemansia helicoidea]|uniref:Uncharacterized protein n=1 Tax=Coemansia helicoidea TaxID=1286919 RepID=A0ACC1L0V5_9FUNG|nr:hypothetical protein H4R21_003629 [Coemansia helicoidea]